MPAFLPARHKLILGFLPSKLEIGKVLVNGIPVMNCICAVHDLRRRSLANPDQLRAENDGELAQLRDQSLTTFGMAIATGLSLSFPIIAWG